MAAPSASVSNGIEQEVNMIDFMNPTLPEAFYLGVVMGGILGLGIGFMIGFFALQWCGFSRDR